MNTLPLSWCRKDTEYSSYKTVNLPLSGMTWVSTADLPLSYTKKDIYQDLAARYPDFVIRGLSHDTAEYFSEKGADVIQTGAEAVVDLDKPDLFKQSVLELANRGRKHGSSEEIASSVSSEERLKELIKNSTHGKEPRLLHLYRAGFDSSTRCFVFTKKGDTWLGAITVSIRDGRLAQTESILRRKNAPVGVMEALFVSIIETLRGEGYRRFSLGEVPFVTTDNQTELSGRCVSKLVFRSKIVIGRSFDYKGLYNFKNKFGPEWSPVYLAAKPGISLRLLIDLYFKSRFHNLTVFKVIDGLKKRIPLLYKTA